MIFADGLRIVRRQSFMTDECTLANAADPETAALIAACLNAVEIAGVSSAMAFLALEGPVSKFLAEFSRQVDRIGAEIANEDAYQAACKDQGVTP